MLSESFFCIVRNHHNNRVNGSDSTRDPGIHQLVLCQHISINYLQSLQRSSLSPQIYRVATQTPHEDEQQKTLAFGTVST